ncbi:unnamed protein product [Brassicogethes aeneus]|uniref:Sulfotransferase domain-containing protein n=1 Tax=Brassicogethes aeneus TaxID=1431903 RepID=A0A9P0FNH6_BRAAE|nr:unnamed protein product [Brassicogethes aeneus]
MSGVTVLNILESSLLNEETNNNNNNNVKQGKKRLKFPYDIIGVDEEVNKELLKDFTGEKTGFVQVGPKKWFFPSGYVKEAENYYNFEPRPDDVWVVTYPRSGTTWSQEMVWLLANNLDYERAEKVPLVDRFPFLEFTSFIHDETLKEFVEENKHCPENLEMVKNTATPAWKLLQAWKQRRFIKTHLPFDLLPPNLLKLGCKKLRSGIEKVSTFLNQEYSKNELDILEEHLKFDNFQNNKSVNMDVYKRVGILKSGEQGFIRKGKSGGWKDYFTQELNKKADKWIEENLKTTDLTFPQIK